MTRPNRITTRWKRAYLGWRSICSLRSRAEAGGLPAETEPFWTEEWRRRRVEALVGAAFKCSNCGGPIDPDQTFGVAHRAGERIVTETPATDLLPVCGDCRRRGKVGHTEGKTP